MANPENKEIAIGAEIGCGVPTGMLTMGVTNNSRNCDTGTDPVATKNQLGLFIDKIGKNNFYLNGVGTRDIDIKNVPEFINVVDLTASPYNGVTIVEAWLYWNILASNDTAADEATFDSNGPFTGQLIGWSNNTCWKAFNDTSNEDGGDPSANIFNRVYRYDVTSYVSITGGAYSVMLTGISTQKAEVDGTATLGSDTPAYPGCNGSQGVALFIIYSTPSGPERRIITYDGSVLITNPSAGFEGVGQYSVTINPDCYSLQAKIATAVGDAQSKYSDRFLWNNTPFPITNNYNSYFDPNAGNLLFTGARAGSDEQESVSALQSSPNVAKIDVTYGSECINWFLFAYAACKCTPDLATRCATPTVSNNNRRFVSP